MRGTACRSFAALDPVGVVAALSYPDGGLLPDAIVVSEIESAS